MLRPSGYLSSVCSEIRGVRLRLFAVNEISGLITKAEGMPSPRAGFTRVRHKYQRPILRGVTGVLASRHGLPWTFIGCTRPASFLSSLLSWWAIGV
jgi:hypothetical protein